MPDGAPLVLDLLNYIEQVEKLKRKPAFSVPTEYFVAYQHDLNVLPELKFNVQSNGDDVWLRLPRLREIPPPEPDDELRPWLTLSKSADRPPELKNEIALSSEREGGQRATLDEHPEVKESFDWYVEMLWAPWALAERPRRKAIKQYNQLFSLQQAIASEGAETPIELVWGIGFVAWKKDGFSTPVRHPLIVQACEVILDENTFDLEVRPRDIEPRIELDCYAEMELQGVRPLEAHWKAALAAGASRVNPFEISTFEGTLKAAVGHLDPSGSYETLSNDAPIPVPDERLKVTSAWVIFGRKRTGDIFLEDIRRLKKSVEEARELPDVIRSLVEPGDATVTVRPEVPFRGLSSSESPQGAFELYFPMAYNDEQVSIVQKLESNDGVVVQGPPGTGKTHTIANVICHYLAHGKRVLVTSKGETALTELQNKLPSAIKPLSVALLSDERDGMRQFEHAIQTIASNVASLNPRRSLATISTAEAKLNQLHAKIANVDAQISGFAAKHMRSYRFQGVDVTPEEMSKRVLQAADEHAWFDDEPPPAKDGELPFDNSKISELRTARLKVSEDLKYVGCPLPTIDEFPAWEELLVVHNDLLKAKAIQARVDQGNLLGLIDSRLETFEKAQSLQRFLEERAALIARLEESRPTLGDTFQKRIADLLPTDPLLHASAACCAEVRGLELRRREFLAKAIQVPSDAELNADYREAIDRLAANKSPFAFPFGRGDARRALAATSVLGALPSGSESAAHVRQVIIWRDEARKCLAQWSSLAQEFGLPPLSDSEMLEARVKRASAIEGRIEDARRLKFDFDDALHARIAAVFGNAVADQLWAGGESHLKLVAESLKSNLEKSRLAIALKRVQDLNRRLENRSGPIVDALRAFCAETLGDPGIAEPDLKRSWGSLSAELIRLAGMRSELDTIAQVTHSIDSAGARKWAKRARSIPATSDVDQIVPASWLEAWNWRQAVMFLDRIEGHTKVRELFEERKTLTAALARTYQELVSEKTWLGVHENSPDAVRQALQAYLNAVQAMGAGTGVRAVRHRKNARDAMARAYRAVPCWVLPQWRVSETIPPEVGLFDLVVIDEASQSDIWALPALLRGKKVLVVGDHKQVSPSAVGTAEERVRELTSRFLANQPFGSEMTPDKSIYDLAKVVFAGNSVMLKEHFRCVPAIIEYSNREFYQNDIKALRLPKANERLDPPLIDVYVKGGVRTNDINHAEATAVVNEIAAILADSQFDGRSIGVVTLLGVEQAAHIHELVSERISPVDIVGRKISIGPPPIFQGKERDIMLVSMVIGVGDRAAANRADMQQRFNVAMSRARDRMYLFRSITESDVREDSLNGRVMQHFRQPFRRDFRKVEALREQCESGFEREMFDELVKRGFRVTPQVPCGGYRIDLVVEGNEGRRLAIECDGDRFHGPAQWQDDMARQRVLERAGWTFWRCFASSFVRRRESVLADLLHTLHRLGIEPLGAESVDNTAWVLTREVDPLGVGAASGVA